MGQGVFDGYTLAQLGSPHRRLLALAQFGQEALVGVNAHAAAAHTRRTALTQRTGGTDGSREVDGAARREGQLDLGRTAEPLARPIACKGGLGETGAVAHRPRFTVDGARGRPLAHPAAAQVAAVEMQFREIGETAVTLASAALAAVIPTAQTSPLSRSCSTWRL